MAAICVFSRSRCFHSLRGILLQNRAFCSAPEVRINIALICTMLYLHFAANVRDNFDKLNRALIGMFLKL